MTLRAGDVPGIQRMLTADVRTVTDANGEFTALLQPLVGRGGTLAFRAQILRPIRRSPEDGARTPIYLAIDPAVAGVTGGYFVNCRQRRSARLTYDETIAEKLWEISEQLTLSERRLRHSSAQ